MTEVFTPDWVSPPGDTILDLLLERNWTQAQLSERMGYTTKQISQLIDGKTPINEEIAIKLSQVLGSTPKFWLNREAQYRKTLMQSVFYTLAKVQFNPIAQMSDYVAKLQEHLRHNGFPDFRAENQSIQQMRWSFTNIQRTEGYLLFSNALIFHTTTYDTFADFLKKTLSGLKLIHEIVELAYIDEIGLRYLNSLNPINNQRLQASLYDFFANLEGCLNHSFTETIVTIEDGSLVIRAVITDGALALPPDLLPLQLELQPQFAEINGRNIVIDTDYFVAKRTSFNLEEIREQLLKKYSVYCLLKEIWSS